MDTPFYFQITILGFCKTAFQVVSLINTCFNFQIPSAITEKNNFRLRTDLFRRIFTLRVMYDQFYSSN